MKVAVSIPDDIFEQGEAMARRLGTSRSRLYAQALNAYLERPTDQELTAMANALADIDDPDLDGFVRAAGRTVLENVEW
jgi:metal-responsive CopG/Arc/MetJ family transcriptional regulator